MVVEFRCENCGKLLSVEDQPTGKVKCPYCKAKVQVPAGVADLPRPRIPVGAGAAPAESHSETSTQPKPAEPHAKEQDAFTSVMSHLMPWVISLFFHAGILVVLSFVTIVMIRTTAPADFAVPDTEFMDRSTANINPWQTDANLQSKALQPEEERPWAKQAIMVPLEEVGETEVQVGIYGMDGDTGDGGAAEFKLFAMAGANRPKVQFVGVKGKAYHIVYLVDRSGSMLTFFDEIRRELLTSISRLHETQTFHVIFFSEGPPEENPSRKLVYATEQAKRGAARYLQRIETISTTGVTDPIPALTRAFRVLSDAPNTRAGKVIYMLTDGDFFDNEKVCQAIREMNSKKQVRIHTILNRFENQDAADILKRIAEENGGRFKVIQSSE